MSSSAFLILLVAVLVATLSLGAAWLILWWFGNDAADVFAGAGVLSFSLTMIMSVALKLRAYRGTDAANG